MRKLDAFQSVDDISYNDYLYYNEVLAAKKRKLVSKKDWLFLSSLVVSLGSLGLLALSPLFILLSTPLICVGSFLSIVAIHSIYINHCKKADDILKIHEYSRLKKSGEFARVANLMREFELTDRFAQEKLGFEISALNKQAENFSKSNSKEDVVVLTHILNELHEKEYLLGLINKKPETNSVVKKFKLEQNDVNSNTLNLN